ncbi:MAG TPA: sulfatase-like hydrolase/transferase, partial [Pseudomonadales bacterium]|nr:sulfatase-like hydrolase/transferase [Pseudomonadales bacterium]
RLVKNKVDVKDRTLKPRGEDAVLIRGEKPRLMVVIVGETLRADHIGLNGYHRQTTPLLAVREDVYSFKDVSACGTSTAFSVPCMFALEGMEDYDRDETRYIENVLDVAKRAGVNVVWLDNNSDSKGVADRVTFMDYKNPANNPVCEDECRDEGMWQGLQEVVAQSNQRHTLIVLHQMGNHGPAYFRRYPARFAKYMPVCETNQLEQCPREHIVNAYDNIIYYTDYFINGVINHLDSLKGEYDTSMLYISDHGESLGENNLYLHGLPYAFAPDEQKKVPMLLWIGEDLAQTLETSSLKEQRNNPLSHDVISHTILGMLNIKTSVYRSELDILAPLHD